MKKYLLILIFVSVYCGIIFAAEIALPEDVPYYTQTKFSSSIIKKRDKGKIVGEEKHWYVISNDSSDAICSFYKIEMQKHEWQIKTDEKLGPIPYTHLVFEKKKSFLIVFSKTRICEIFLGPFTDKNGNKKTGIDIHIK